jgi:hypothetical protein
MNKRTCTYAVICIVVIIVGFFFVTRPQERLLLSKEFTSLEYYPQYYYTNFTVLSSDTNAVITLNLNLSFTSNYSDCVTCWILFQLQPEQFEAVFNVTKANDIMASEDWTLDDLNAFWAGWFATNRFPSLQEPIPAASYVFVFWTIPDGPTIGWSATFTVSLRTSIFPSA